MATPIIVPRRYEDFFSPDGTFTLRALRFFESLTDVTNGNTDDLDDLIPSAVLTGEVLRLSQQVGSGQKVTIDTTGFTVDTTFQTTDRTEA